MSSKGRLSSMSFPCHGRYANLYFLWHLTQLFLFLKAQPFLLLKTVMKLHCCEPLVGKPTLLQSVECGDPESQTCLDMTSYSMYWVAPWRKHEALV